MKRMVIALVAIMLMTGFASVSAEDYDFSGKSLEELYTLREALNAKITELEQTVEKKVYGSGTYMVGGDIPVGDYVLVETDNAMFASVIIREGESEDSKLLAQHLINHQLVIRLQADTWVTLSEADAYPLATAPGAEDGVTGEGGYLVGAQLPAGMYIVKISDKAPLSSYSVYEGIRGVGSQLTRFEVVRQDVVIELMDGEYIELSGCTLAPAAQ